MNARRPAGIGATFVTIAPAVLVAAAAGAPAAAPAERTILSIDSPWRWHIAWRRPAVSPPGGKADVLPVDRRAFTHRPKIQLLETPPPPGEWPQADFDAGGWPRDLDGLLRTGEVFQLGLVALRGRFAVTDPGAVSSLRLHLVYRGGAVAYLNGREVARGHLPEGAVAATTPALPYPDEVWADAKGGFLQQRDTEKDLAARRTRRLEVPLPTDHLRKGVNVLAVELHRSDYHPAALGWFAHNRNMRYSWVPIRLEDVRLTATGEGIRPNVGRPPAPVVWNVDPHERLDASDRGDPTEPLGPMRMVAARNAVASGAVAVSAPGELRGVRAAGGELVGPAGRIPRSAVRVRYVVPGTIETPARRPAYDGLLDRPPGIVKPAPAALQPIWITVSVPGGAAAGAYRGTLTVSAEGLKPVAVPLELTVIDWVAPDPAEFRTVVNLYQSPTSLAMQYRVELWSEPHWKLMEQAFELLAAVGCDMVNVPVVEQTQFGNDPGTVFWVKRPGGGFDHDFAVFDRYLGLVRKHLGRPRLFVLHVWHAAGWGARKPDHKNTVTVIDPKTHRRVQSLQVPVFATPESKAFWTPVLHALRDRLAKAGMAGSLCLGILADGNPEAKVCAMFDEILPGVGWTKGCHRSTWSRTPLPMKGGGSIVCQEFCYSLGIKPPGEGVATIWDQPGPGVAYIRKDFDNIPPLRMRATAERGLYCNTAGVGRFCLDFWRFGGRRGSNLFNRYPHSSCAQREPTTCRMAHPGPDGPVASVRLELFREGLQEAEAAIAIAEAAHKWPGQLGSELTGKCRRVLLERVNFARVVHESYQSEAWDHTGWRERTARLFATAGEVQKKLVPRPIAGAE